MTPEQLEAAARLVCEKRGIDPDERLVSVSVDMRTRKNDFMWQRVAMEVKGQYEVLTSIATVLDMEVK